MRILITGKNGYIGSSIINKLKAYNYNVTGVGREDFDLTDRKSTNTYFDYKKFDIIIHTAIYGGSRLEKDGNDVLANNLKMFYNLLNNQDKFGQLINFGSGAELNNPSLPYGLSKAIIWDIIKNNSKLNNIRIFGVFDENELDTRFIKSNIKRYIRKEPLLINQDKLMDFIYMDDLITLIDYVIQNPYSKLTEASYLQPYSLVDIANLINELSDYKCKVIVTKPKLGKMYTGNINNINNINLPFIGLEKAIKLIYKKIKYGKSI